MKVSELALALGITEVQRRDFRSQIKLMAEEGIEAGIACAVIGDRIGISIKARESSKINAQKIAGLFGGGGRFDEAGASMPLGPFSDYKLDDKVLLDAIIDSLIIPKIENEM